MNILRKTWTAIRRNPVINGFVLALLAQLAHDYMANEIDWTNIAGYLATVFIAIAVREFTVPAKENQATKRLVAVAIADAEANYQKKTRELRKLPEPTEITGDSID